MKSSWSSLMRRGLVVLVFNTILSALVALVTWRNWLTAWVYAQCIGVLIWLVMERLGTWLDPNSKASLKARLAVTPIGIGLGYVGGAALADALLGAPYWGHWNVASNQRWGELAITVIAGIVVTAYFTFREHLAASRAEAESAKRLAAETQLRLLQAQLEPHMLFNTLANLRVLISVDPAKAQVMLDHFIAFLRSTLGASRADVSGQRHTLVDEFARLADYLALMQIRMGDRLQVKLDLQEDLRGSLVPPLLLQPLVENAIQHGLEPKREGGTVHVQAQGIDGHVCITISDTGLGLHADPRLTTTGTHFGLQQVRDRLNVTWGDAAQLTIQARDSGGTQVQLRWPVTKTI